jgi:hypothetical protein
MFWVIDKMHKKLVNKSSKSTTNQNAWREIGYIERL